MARTYTLTSTSVNAGYSSSGWTDGNWDNYRIADSSWAEERKSPRVGYYYQYRAANFLFDSNLLGTLRSKTINSINLTVTVVSGTIAANSTAYPIGYKFDNQASTSTAGSAWARGNADSTAKSATIQVGQLTSTSKIEGNNTPLTINLTGSSVPVNGYVIGANSSSISTNVRLGTSATLVIVTSESLTLSYNGNGSGSTNVPSSSTSDGNPNHTFTISSTRPTRAGYSFLGWSTSSTATTASYQPGGTITLDSNTTLYAVWKLANTIRIANGSSLDLYLVYVVENNALSPYLVRVANGTSLDIYT